MSLLDDYLRAVAILLPKDQREDIVAELRDMILTRIESLETQTGRALADTEIEAVLREVGHPLVVASRYRGGPQHVVGPALYPYWTFAVKIAVTIQLVLAAVIFLARSLIGGNLAHAFGDTLGSGLSGAMTLVGFATVAAWLIERHGVKIDYLDRWRVRDLGVLKFAAWDWESMRDLGARRAQSAFGRRRARGPWWDNNTMSRGLGAIAAGTVLVLWWTGVLRLGVVGNLADLGALGLAPGSLAEVDWPALEAMMFWPVLAFGGAIIAQGVLMLIRPGARRLCGLFDLVIGAATVAAVGWLSLASPLAFAVRVDSLTELAVRLKRAFVDGPPVALAPLVSLTLVMTAFGGLLQMIRGTWGIMASRPAVTLVGHPDHGL